jgi:hypothetical protein
MSLKNIPISPHPLNSGQSLSIPIGKIFGNFYVHCIFILLISSLPNRNDVELAVLYTAIISVVRLLLELLGFFGVNSDGRWWISEGRHMNLNFIRGAPHG